MLGGILEHWLRTDEARAKSKTNIGKPSKFLTLLLYLLGGGIIGGLSIALFPENFLQNEISKIAFLIISPLIAGSVMHLIAKQRITQGKQIVSFENFYNGFLFAFGISLTRFLFAA